MKSKIHAYWMRDNNFGDKLTPYLIKKITGEDAIYCEDTTISRIIGVGSILNWASDRDVVWGAGLANASKDRVNKYCDIRSIRGPISRQSAINCGNTNVPEIYGDPAMLLPRFYNPNVEKKYKLGIIPHVVEFSHLKKPSRDDILNINLSDSVDNVIKNINECENIISSSLHGIVVADAYDIPCKWVKFSNKILGDGTKYMDHYMSIGIDDMKITNVDINNINIDIIDIIDKIEKYDIMINLDKLMDSCPFK